MGYESGVQHQFWISTRCAYDAEVTEHSAETLPHHSLGKEYYKNIIVTSSKIGHTSLSNTTDEQILDGITELFIMSNSTQIIAASNSGFSQIASKFKHMPFHHLNSLY